MKRNPLEMIDFYKADHISQYPEGTTKVYSNFTPRSNKYGGYSNKVVFFGLQYFIKEYLQKTWDEGFFKRDKTEVISEYKRRMDNALGPNMVDVTHFEKLHDLGFLPIAIHALPEGSLVPMGIPVFTVENTLPDFFWLTNYMESILSAILWKPMTSATTAYTYRKEFERHVDLTGYDVSFLDWQGHDFSFRGMSGLEDSVMSGAGHLLSFTGTDTVSAISFLEEYYNADSDKELIGGSVPATEHSVMSMGSFDGEFDTFKRLITETYPKGIVSIVSDTWDFWKVVTEFLPKLRPVIISREGRVVIRPDSGDPVEIIAGMIDDDFYTHEGEKVHKATKRLKSDIPEHEILGAFEMLWRTFGGTINEKGFKELDTHIGLIYGDSITLDRQKEILRRLEYNNFSANNLVLGIGSYTYEYVTRDTFGFAMKATYGEINHEGVEIFKSPKTDSGLKKSARGLLKVYKDVSGEYKLKDRATVVEAYNESLLKTVYFEGQLIRNHTLSEIRDRLKNEKY